MSPERDPHDETDQPRTLAGTLTISRLIGDRAVTIVVGPTEIRALRDHLAAPAVWGGHSRAIDAEMMSLTELLTSHLGDHDRGQLERSSTPVAHTHDDGRWLADERSD